MTFFQRTLQLFFLILGIILVGMFIVRWIAPDSRTVLWTLLCPANAQIEIASGEAELEPGEVVAAYEVVCVGQGIRQPLLDIQLIFVEMGFSVGLAGVVSVILGWILSRSESRGKDNSTLPLPR